MIAIPIESSNYLEVGGGGGGEWRRGVDFTDEFQDEPEGHKWDLILLVEMWCDWPAYRLKQYVNSCHTGPPNNTTHNKKPTVTSNKSQKAIRKWQFSFAYNREFSFFPHCAVRDFSSFTGSYRESQSVSRRSSSARSHKRNSADCTQSGRK